MNRTTARFFTTATSLAQCPRWSLPEIAVAGRSNVGKSSLINAITKSRGLARTSKTPGRTQALNFFVLDEKIGLVDLPGFGYAQVPQAAAERIADTLREYLLKRETLVALVLLIDCRRGPEDDERSLADLMKQLNRQVIVVGTKSDKLKRSEIAPAVRALSSISDTPILTSALKGDGIEALRKKIFEIGARSVSSEAPVHIAAKDSALR